MYINTIFRNIFNNFITRHLNMKFSNSLINKNACARMCVCMYLRIQILTREEISITIHILLKIQRTNTEGVSHPLNWKI